MILLVCTVAACADRPAQSVDFTTYSYNCDDYDTVIVVTLSGDHGYLFSKQASEAIDRDAVSGAYVGADVFYLPDRVAGLAAAQSAKIVINGEEFRNCRNNSRAAVWEAAKLRGVSYRAVGQEPPWVLDIHRDAGFVLSSGYDNEVVRFPYTEPESNSSLPSTRYSSQLDGEQLVITIKGEACHDSMSGEVFSSRVEIDWRAQKLRGCGRALH